MIAVDSEKLKTVINILKLNCVECIVLFEPTGAKINIIDHSNVVMTLIHLKPEWFIEYAPVCKKIGLFLPNLINATASVPKNCNIILSASDEKATSIIATYTVGNSTYQGKFKTYDPKTIRRPPENYEDIIRRNLDKTFSITMKNEDYLLALHSIGNFYQSGDNIKSKIIMEFEENNFIISMIDNDDNTMSATIAAKYTSPTSVKITGKTGFMITYLPLFKLIAGLVSKQDDITIYTGDARSIMYDVNAFDDTANIKMLCAPLVTTD